MSPSRTLALLLTLTLAPAQASGAPEGPAASGAPSNPFASNYPSAPPPQVRAERRTRRSEPGLVPPGALSR